MAKQSVYICDGADCKTLIAKSSEGFVVSGTIEVAEANPQPGHDAIINTQDAPGDQQAFCKKCFCKLLGLTLAATRIAV